VSPCSLPGGTIIVETEERIMPDSLLAGWGTVDRELPYQRYVFREAGYPGDFTILHHSEDIPGSALRVPFLQSRERGEIDSEAYRRPTVARGGVSRIATGRARAIVMGSVATGRQLSLYDERYAIRSSKLDSRAATTDASVHPGSASIQTDSER
jgi:hypothetical protein